MRARRNSAMRNKSKNILILLGSPREDGNSTRLAYAFADAASRNGHRVQSIRVPALDIAPCDGCNECWKPAAVPCAIRDDMDSVYPLLRAADVLVFATPLHFYTWSAPLKTLVDRFYCLSPSRKRNLKGKRSVLLATAADDRPVAFAGVKATYRLAAEFMGWKSLGEVLVPDVAAEGDIARRVRHLARADALGAKLA
jgi:multimeric flavodoxin WrbA